MSDLGWPQEYDHDGQPLRAVPASEDHQQAETTRLGQLRAALLDSGGLDDLPDPQPLVDGILYLDTLAWLHGKPGHGKSFVALDVACCVSTGLPWQMYGVTRGPVLYVIAEGVTGLRQRVRAWEANARTRTGVTFLPVPVQVLAEADLQAVIGLAADLKPVLVVIDTQARVTVGADENSARDMGQLVAALDKIRLATRACVLTVHHEARGSETLRGSTAQEGAANTLLRCTRDGTRLEVTCPRQKDAEPFDPISLRLTSCEGTVIVTAPDWAAERDELSTHEVRIIDTLRDTFGDTGAYTSALIDAAGPASRATLSRAIKRLRESGRIINDGTRKQPHYTLPEYVSRGDEILPPAPADRLTASHGVSPSG